MASLTRATTATLAAAGLLMIGSGVFAQTATQADFDACNRMAQAAGVGSTGTGPGGSSSVSAGSADANRQPNSSGRLAPSAGSPGTNTGTTGIGSAGMPSASPRTSVADAQLNGMGATGHSHAAYQQAYRDCMKQRGF